MVGKLMAEEKPLHLPSGLARLPTHWTWLRLDDASAGVFDCPHSTPRLADSGPFLVRSQDIITGVFRAERAARVSEETYKDRTLRVVPTRGDLLYSREGTYFGIAAEVPEQTRVCLGQRMVLIRPKPGVIDFRFLARWLNSPIMASHIRGYRDGTVAERLNLPTIRALPVLIPPLSEQRAIAHILGTLDDKIDLNRRMNETLEAMAQALFKSWFVDFEPVRAKTEGRDPGLPEHLANLFPDSFRESEFGEIPNGWGKGPLGRYFKLGLGGAWGEDSESSRASIAVRCLRGIDCHELAEGRIPDVPLRWISERQAMDRQLVDGTILVEGSGSFCGRSLLWQTTYEELLGSPVCYSNFCKRLDSICSPEQAIVCWLQVRIAYSNGRLQAFRTGTAFPNFDVHGALRNLIVVVPSQPLAKTFANFFRLSQRLDLMAQSRTLTALRDTLLPKLLSGEFRVKDAERRIEEIG